MTNLAAANHENQLVANLPSEHQRATALDFWKLGHGDRSDGKVLGVAERRQLAKWQNISGDWR